MKNTRIYNFFNETKRSYDALSAKGKLFWWGNLIIRYAIYIIIFFLVVYVQIFSLRNKSSNNFFTPKAIVDIIKRASAGMFLALGVGGIIVLTGTDLSAGRIVGLTACFCASMLQKPLDEYSAKMFPELDAPPIILVMLLSMTIGAMIGAFNGFFVAKFKLHPFIVTLATQIILYGALLSYVTLGKNSGGPISGLTEPYKEVVKGTITVGGTVIPYYVFYAIIAVIVMWFIWNKTTLGKNMYAVGANPEAANVSGVSVMKTTIMIFVLAGIFYGFSGFVEAAQTGSNSPTTGDGKELDAIAACVIGGVSFTGGIGKISGIVTGVILLQIISISLQWLGIPTAVQYFVTGGIILAAVTIDSRKNLVKK